MADLHSDRKIEVAYGTAERQDIVELPWTSGLTAGEAIRRSGLLEKLAQTDPDRLVIGIFGREVPSDRVLRPGDRVEICRPLLRDPRDMRREAVAESQVVGAKERG